MTNLAKLPTAAHFTKAVDVMHSFVAVHPETTGVQAMEMLRTLASTLANLRQPTAKAMMFTKAVVVTKVPAASIPAVPLGTEHADPEWVVCLEDGRRMKMLKRHLRAAYGMTADEYKAKWGLPSNYSMVARAYSQRMAYEARAVGLGGEVNKAGGNLKHIAPAELALS